MIVIIVLKDLYSWDEKVNDLVHSSYEVSIIVLEVNDGEDLRDLKEDIYLISIEDL